MSVREEDRQKNCPSRGLGLAAAAIGVGVGAALYYFFSKSPEQPANEGSTSSNWSSEEPQALSEDTSSLDNSETTSDEASDETSPETISDSSHRSTEESLSDEDPTENTYSDTLSTLSSNASGHSDSDESITSVEILSELGLLNLTPIDDTWPPTDSTLNRHETLHTPNSHVRRQNDSSELNSFNTPRRNGSLLNILQALSVDSDADTREWDVTTSSLGLPEDNYERSPSPLRLARMYRDMLYRQYLSGSNRTPTIEMVRASQRFRERSRTVEDCCICFEPMLHDQHLLGLACTHYFHAACIRPWLEEQNTCPNCRKNAIVYIRTAPPPANEV